MYPLQATTIEAGFGLAATRPGPGADRLYRTAPGASVRHMLRAIASDPAEARDQRRWLARVRPLVEREEATLRARFEVDGAVEALLRARTRLADGAVVGLLHLARAAVRSDQVVTAIAPVTVVAVGGYGRRELAPRSDLDLLFLLLDSPIERDRAERMIGFVLAGLWDLGFEVGHATRTLAECRDLASAEPTIFANLLDARLLAGSFGLHAMLATDVERIASQAVADALEGAPAARASATSALDDAERADDEPDVKRGRGALRDVQRFLWRTRLHHGDRSSEGRSGADGRAAGLPAVLVEARRFLGRSGAICTS